MFKYTNSLKSLLKSGAEDWSIAFYHSHITTYLYTAVIRYQLFIILLILVILFSL